MGFGCQRGEAQTSRAGHKQRGASKQGAVGGGGVGAHQQLPPLLGRVGGIVDSHLAALWFRCWVLFAVFVWRVASGWRKHASPGGCQTPNAARPKPRARSRENARSRAVKPPSPCRSHAIMSSSAALKAISRAARPSCGWLRGGAGECVCVVFAAVPCVPRAARCGFAAVRGPVAAPLPHPDTRQPCRRSVLGHYCQLPGRRLGCNPNQNAQPPPPSPRCCGRKRRRPGSRALPAGCGGTRQR